MSIERVGVIGAGQMGPGITHVCALAGLDVVLEDINVEALDRAHAIIERNMHRQAARGMIIPMMKAPKMTAIPISSVT